MDLRSLTPFEFMRLFAEAIGWGSLAISSILVLSLGVVSAKECILQVIDNLRERAKRLDGDRLRPLLFLLAFILPGCAMARYRDPCEFWVKIKMTNQEAANAECHALPNLVNDWGNPVPPDVDVNGCSGQTFFIARYAGMTREHELDHVIEKNCRIR